MLFTIEMFREIQTLDPKTQKVLLQLVEEIQNNAKANLTSEVFSELQATLSRLGDTVSDLAKLQLQTATEVKGLAEAQRKTEAKVSELAEAQRKTEARLDKLAEQVADLTEAQRKTEAKVNELAEAQRKTEARLDKLAEQVADLTEAQRKTEAKVNELAEAQRKTEAKVNELAEAQRKTEAKVSELAEAQRKTEAKVNELAEAQRKTEAAIEKLTYDVNVLTGRVDVLTKDMADVKSQLGGLAMAVGYGIEDKMIPMASKFARNRYNFVPRQVQRTNIRYPDGNFDEVNILISGVRNGQDAYLVGECKAQPGKKDLDRFKQQLERLRSHFQAEVLGFFIGYHYHPDVEDHALQAYAGQIDIYRTYEVEMIANDDPLLHR